MSGCLNDSGELCWSDQDGCQVGNENGAPEAGGDSGPPGPYVPGYPAITHSGARFACGDYAYWCLALGGTYDIDIRDNGWTVDVEVAGAIEIASDTSDGPMRHLRLRATSLGEGSLVVRSVYLDDGGRTNRHDFEPIDFRVRLVSYEEGYGGYTRRGGARAARWLRPGRSRAGATGAGGRDGEAPAREAQPLTGFVPSTISGTASA